MDLQSYFSKGYFVVKNLYSKEEIEVLNSTIHKSLIDTISSNATIIHEEFDKKTVRSIMGYHKHILKEYTYNSKVIDIVSKLINQNIYVSQSKINLKRPSGKGKKWDYHRGFTFWHMLDGMPDLNMVSVFICLTKQTKKNGAVYVLENSHKNFDINLLFEETNVKNNLRENDTSANLSLQIKPEYLDFYKSKYKKKNLIANEGDVIFMHPALLHASDTNTSDSSRNLMITVYNSLDNLPTNSTRPYYLCDRDYKTLN